MEGPLEATVGPSRTGVGAPAPGGAMPITVLRRGMGTPRSENRCDGWGDVSSFESTEGSSTVSSGTTEGTASQPASTRDGRTDGCRLSSSPLI